ncbi:MAG: hypothetical protein ACFE8J_07450 [Candidatus Heimdallarchaeota archaeon]
MSFEDWIFILYFCFTIISMILFIIYVKKEYRKILISFIISSILIPFNLIIQEPFFNFIILSFIISNLVLFSILLFRPFFLIKKEKYLFLDAEKEIEVELNINDTEIEPLAEGD